MVGLSIPHRHSESSWGAGQVGQWLENCPLWTLRRQNSALPEYNKYRSVSGESTLVEILHVETVPCVGGNVGVPVVGVNLDEFLHGACLHGYLSHQLLGRKVTAGVAHHSGAQHLGQVGGGHLGLFTLSHLGGEEGDIVNCEFDQPGETFYLL